jgi:hypothetical protein
MLSYIREDSIAALTWFKVDLAVIYLLRIDA